MPGDKLQTSRNSDHKRKKKKVSSAPVLKQKGKPLAVSLPRGISSTPLLPHPGSSQTPDQLPSLRGTRKKNGKQSASSGWKIKIYHKSSQNLHQNCEDQALAHVDEFRVQTRESLRWEGVLMDPQEEAQRLELYRANRRQRYIAHREATGKKVDSDHNISV